MSQTQVGSCPRCGAPIYAPTFYMNVSILPPPVTKTCWCFPEPYTYTTSSTNTSEAR